MEEVKLSLSRDDTILSVENTKEIQKKITRINEFSKARHKKNQYKNEFCFLHASNKQTTNEINTIPFIIAPNRIKYLGINVKEMR